jgi:2,4-dienoyl-CoA reductase-like NADH-dependent reductase (Old Yellow Enzyme family)
MAQHARFNYKSLDELKADIAKLGVNIPVSSNTAILGQPMKIGNKTVPNRLAITPMEGCDGTAEGSPGELTRRRYRRFAEGGSGLLWFEATAVLDEGRANPRQLSIKKETAGDFAAMLQESLTVAKEAGYDRPFTVLQLTHSGRYSNPGGSGPAPRIAARNPYLDKRFSDIYVMTDEDLERLEDRYVDAAVMAADAGFDAVDIKNCHGYLLAELLSAHTREGRYGGSFENRTRLVCNIADKIKNKLGDKITLAIRLGVFDEVPYPYGWGVDKKDHHKPDFSEPAELLKLLGEKGVKLVNISMGSPYYNPHLTRPYDAGAYLPPKHPLEGVEAMLGAARTLQAAVPDASFMGVGLSWLRQFAPYVAAGCIEKGWFNLAGFGRQAFAYPGFAGDLLKKGAFDPTKTCLTCSMCTVIMRDGGCTGCVPRDAAVYASIYKKGREGKVPAESDRVAEHI